jgi:sensor histidine kinase regulating citrate/malate metabolism
MFYNFIFFAFEENYEIYTLDTYVVFAISILGVAHSIFLTLNLAIKNLLSDRQNRELRSFMQMQQQQYDYQLKQSVQVRSFKHDLVNHIGVLRELISENRTEKAKEYIDRIWELQNEFDLKIHTGDSFLDVIVNYYGYLAEKEKIDFTVGGQITDKLGLEMFDITTLVGNILQNAVEAAKKTTAPKIRMELIEHKKEIFIVVKNSVCRAAGLQKDFLTTSKPDKEEHGFGLKNIAETVEKYQGEYYMDFLTEKGENLFQISISIPKGEPL